MTKEKLESLRKKIIFSIIISIISALVGVVIDIESGITYFYSKFIVFSFCFLLIGICYNIIFKKEKKKEENLQISDYK